MNRLILLQFEALSSLEQFPIRLNYSLFHYQPPQHHKTQANHTSLFLRRTNEK